jgi:hypothetical protein
LPERTQQLTTQIIKLFNEPFLTSHKKSGEVSHAPIFIISMPRSGSTLVEQILASHPLVHGGNELPDIQQTLISSRQFSQPGSDILTNLTNLNAKEFKQLGQLYLERIAKRYKTPKPFFTDKMPFNFQLLGFIKLILPNAKIIHVKRNPIDTCMGCFKLPFNEHHDFTYDLKELGHYYSQYHRLMQHWRSVLPNGFYELDYEELVHNQELKTRQLLDYCELPWDENCLTFYKTKRVVITESAGQVRQPIYTTAINAWQPYASYIEPLLTALQPVLHH